MEVRSAKNICTECKNLSSRHEPTHKSPDRGVKTSSILLTLRTGSFGTAQMPLAVRKVSILLLFLTGGLKIHIKKARGAKNRAP